mmetsp:Transcript_15553/g.22654  ORF Transcript_15553/g.22654 Transcript_15553/m.22654 type:complete len:92 (+) Transcript_15553:376-651(+)
MQFEQAPPNPTHNQPHQNPCVVSGPWIVYCIILKLRILELDVTNVLAEERPLYPLPSPGPGLAANSFQKGRFIKNDEIDIGEEEKEEQAPI